MRYYHIDIQVDFKTPRKMPPLLHADKPWQSVGYFQTFCCTELSKEKAKKLVYHFFLEDEENPSICQFKYDRVAWMRNLTDLTQVRQLIELSLTGTVIGTEKSSLHFGVFF